MTVKRHIHNGDQLAWLEQQPDAALEEYRKALAMDPKSAVAHWRIGQLHLFALVPRTDEAIGAFREAVRSAASWSEAHYCLGISLAEKKHFREAIEEHHQAIALSEHEDERLFISLGRCLFENKSYSLAVKAYQNGIRVARHPNPVYYDLLGDGQLAMKRLTEACAAWRRALELASESSDDEREQVAAELRQKISANCGERKFNRS